MFVCPDTKEFPQHEQMVGITNYLKKLSDKYEKKKEKRNKSKKKFKKKRKKKKKKKRKKKQKKKRNKKRQAGAELGQAQLPTEIWLCSWSSFITW